MSKWIRAVSPADMKTAPAALMLPPASREAGDQFPYAQSTALSPHSGDGRPCSCAAGG